ncbi:MAG: trypsin-like peptidase domain-containing protein [Cellvibrionales bacterium]|nr:trypsin-like peptidase domain-containing protein [Cellvibrionales bacterium]
MQRASILFGFSLGLIAAGLVLLIKDDRKSSNFPNAIKKATPAVVNIYTKSARDIEARETSINSYRQLRKKQRFVTKNELSLGSGVIYDNKGHIITNLHVINGADQITIMLFDGRKAVADVLGKDPETDLAILKITLDDLTSATLGRSDTIQVGDAVLAIGNPYGFGQSVSAGIVSAKGRYGLNRNQYENFIQTDAALNIGSSGGALINDKGQVVGINTTIFSLTGEFNGISLAIPIETVQKVTKDIIEHGFVIRGWLGIDVRIQTDQSFDHGKSVKKVIVDNVVPGSPAEMYGIKVGDSLISFNNKRLSKQPRSLLAITNLKPNDNAKIVILRGSEHRVLNIPLGTKPTSEKPIRVNHY